MPINQYQSIIFVNISGQELPMQYFIDLLTIQCYTYQSVEGDDDQRKNGLAGQLQTVKNLLGVLAHV